jgi:cell division protein FtsL
MNKKLLYIVMTTVAVVFALFAIYKMENANANNVTIDISQSGKSTIHKPKRITEHFRHAIIIPLP